MLTALTKDKKGLFALPLMIIFFGMLVMLVLVIIFKDRLVSLFETIGGLFQGKLWIAITITLVIVFRKFVLELLMWILKIIRGILKL
jgi:uncharacterized membrane protein (DUF485 family)